MILWAKIGRNHGRNRDRNHGWVCLKMGYIPYFGYFK